MPRTTATRCPPDYSGADHFGLHSSRRGTLPDLPQPPPIRTRSTSRSRTGFGGLFHRQRHDQSPAYREPDYSDAESSGGEQDGASSGVGMFSRQARSATRASRTRQRAYSQPLSPVTPLESPTASPLSPTYVPFLPGNGNADGNGNGIDGPLFATAFTPRQLSRLSRASAHTQEKERKAEEKQEKKARKGNFRAEAKIAMGIFEMVSEQRKTARKDKKERSRSRGRSSAGGFEGEAGGGQQETLQQKLVGAFAEVEERFQAPPGSGASRPGSAPAAPIQRAVSAVSSNGTAPQGKGWEKALAAGGGAAALIGLAGAGVEWWEHEHTRKQAERTGRAPSAASYRSSHAPASPTPEHDDLHASHPAIRPASAASVASTVPVPVAHVPTSLPLTRPLSAPHPATLPPPGSQKVYLSSLTPQEHHLVQHAAAALLLKDRARGTLHQVFHEAVGGIEGLVEGLERGAQDAWEGMTHHGRPKKLFGTDLHYLTHHEGIDSFHGVNPQGTVRIPEFIDHCITAMMQMDVTVEGILRKSGNFRVITEIINALDSSGGNDTVIDLAKLDPVTIADLFKRFLASLPDPVLTSSLFKLFIACSHISHVGLRKRAMHLVICLMPKVNRDVMEVVFLFLDWLSTYAHIDVKDGNRMDLSAISRVMAPTLLRPHHRDAKPEEVPSMISSVLMLLEDQHVLHEIPLELAQVLHISVPPQLHKDSAGLVQHLARLL
ncbi:hypothetical protein JCM11641_002743 [Rhodosporidiobolus odoratus]